MTKSELFQEELILPQVETTNLHNLFGIMTDRLFQEGCIKESYYESILEREEKYPTGLYMGEYNIAIPHTEATHVKKPGIAIAVLKNPIAFRCMDRSDEYVDVSIVIMMALKDSHKHMETLGEIIRIFQDKSLLEKLAKADDKKVIMNLINQKI